MFFLDSNEVNDTDDESIEPPPMKLSKSNSAVPLRPASDKFRTDRDEFRTDRDEFNADLKCEHG